MSRIKKKNYNYIIPEEIIRFHELVIERHGGRSGVPLESYGRAESVIAQQHYAELRYKKAESKAAYPRVGRRTTQGPWLLSGFPCSYADAMKGIYVCWHQMINGPLRPGLHVFQDDQADNKRRNDYNSVDQPAAVSDIRSVARVPILGPRFDDLQFVFINQVGELA